MLTHGKKNDTITVAITGALIRHESLKVEAITLILARQVAQSLGLGLQYPLGNFSCEFDADYYIGVVLKALYFDQGGAFGYFNDILSDGISQLTAMFSFPYWKERQGGELNGCKHPLDGLMLSCRFECFRTSVTTYYTLPKCAQPSSTNTNKNNNDLHEDL